jgi:hypothetical protein
MRTDSETVRQTLSVEVARVSRALCKECITSFRLKFMNCRPIGFIKLLSNQKLINGFVLRRFYVYQGYE